MIDTGEFEARGFAWARGAAEHLDCSSVPRQSSRDALRWPIAHDRVLTDLASSALGCTAHPVRALLFAKSAGSNWSVPWHQDRVVAVAERSDVPGFSGWSVKAGVPHANAPEHVLRSMVALRVHLDPCPTSAGALEVVAGSHAFGIVPAEQARRAASPSTHVLCPAQRGDVFLMRPLLLHRSSSQRGATHSRRVLHIEYAAQQLPHPLSWANSPVFALAV